MQSLEFSYKQWRALNGETGQLLLDVHWLSDSAESVSPGSHPIVIIFHGGGFVQGSKSIIPRMQIESLCHLGFVAVIPNYRLCPQISLYDGPVTDSLDCLEWVATSLPAILQKEPNAVKVDTERIVVMGHSAGASLALLVANSPIPVRAVLDFYGGKYYADPTWHTPSPFFASALDYPESLAEKIFEGPQVSAAIPSAGADEVSARDAWLSNAFKSGKHLSLIAKGVNYELIDGSNGFSSKFPPTMFVHGTGDTITPSRISERAQKELSHLGAESHIVLVEGANHMFDMFFTDPEDEAYKTYVVKAFQFLAVKAGLS